MEQNNCQHQEIFDFLSFLEQNFCNKDILNMQALLYLYYYDTTVFQHQNKDFTERLNKLVELCNLSLSDIQTAPKQEEIKPCCDSSPQNQRECTLPPARPEFIHEPVPTLPFARDPWLKRRSFEEEIFPWAVVRLFKF